MAAPATTGLERTKIADMKIGDYISCTCNLPSSWDLGYFRELGRSTALEMPYSGFGSSSAIQNGKFYFIKVDRGLLIADRIIRNSIPWTTINNTQFIQGSILVRGAGGLNDDASFDVQGSVRSLTGGVSWAYENGMSATINQNFGAFPATNEWDKYIVNSDLGGKIIKGDDNVWHWSGGLETFCRDMPMIGLVVNTNTMNNTHRVTRGLGTVDGFNGAVATGTWATVGFRPVFEYKEV